jgi:hypothetical protein
MNLDQFKRVMTEPLEAPSPRVTLQTEEAGGRRDFAHAERMSGLVASHFLSLLSINETARFMPEGLARNQQIAAAGAALSKAMEDYCGAPPRTKDPHDLRGMIVFSAALQLRDLALTLPDCELRSQISAAAAKLGERMVRGLFSELK